MGRGTGRWIWAAAGLALLAGNAEAQRRYDRDGYRRDRGARAPTVSFGVSIIAADPIGDLGYYFDAGVGAQFEGSFAMERSGHLRLRTDLGFIVYGHERLFVCYDGPFGCRVGEDLTTTNTIFFGGLGPELRLATGHLEPYVNASYGFAAFVTTSSLDGYRGDYYDDRSHTNHSDATMAWRAGGGLRLRLKAGRTPIHLDFGAERHENGIADFLTEGDIVDHPDGSTTMYVNRSEANLVTYRLGISFGFGGRRGP
jgi:hypothetical protein